jgi:hypothetical protein
VGEIGGNRDVLGECAVHMRHSEKDDGGAEVITTGFAEAAAAAGDAWLHSDAFTDSPRVDPLPNSDDDPCALVTQDKGSFDDPTPDATRSPPMDVGTADADSTELHQHLSGTGLGDRPLLDADLARPT